MNRSGGRRPRVVISIFDHRDYSGGGPVVIGGIVRQLAPDYDVVLVTPSCRVDTAGMRAGVRVISIPIGWTGPRIGQMLYLPLILLYALFVRHDLWIESFTPPFSSSFLPMVTRRPVIGLAQALSAREMARKYGMSVLLSIERFALRRYGHVVVLNPFDRQVVEACNPRAVVRLIPNTITMPPPPRQDSGTGEFCLFLGRLDVTQKGLDLLAAAYRHATPGALPLVVAGAGTGADEGRLADLLRPIPHRVRLAGHVQGQRKAELLETAAFLVMPSREESFGIVALEAMAHGRPVVHFDLPQLAWIPGDCGVKVPAFDSDQLAGAIEELSRDPARRSELGRRARDFATRHYAEHAGAPYVRLVREVLGGVGSAVAEQPQRQRREDRGQHRAGDQGPEDLAAGRGA
jgi:glycosyltransferase involved in cell wall biosynthesis